MTNFLRFLSSCHGTTPRIRLIASEIGFSKFNVPINKDSFILRQDAMVSIDPAAPSVCPIWPKILLLIRAKNRPLKLETLTPGKISSSDLTSEISPTGVEVA